LLADALSLPTIATDVGRAYGEITLLANRVLQRAGDVIVLVRYAE
jgi:hypothetical protein